MKHYRIGDIDILLDPGPITVEDDPLTVPFLSAQEPGPDPVIIRGQGADMSFLKDWEIELYTGGYEIRRREGRRFLLHHRMTHRFAYGLYLDELFGNGPIYLYYNENLLGELTLKVDHCLNSVGIHHRLLQRGCAVVHASYIAHEGKGILFTAPSQTGKSTQAELWRQYRGAEIINGDRTLLFNRDGIWYAGGYIACGTSGICKNKTLPLNGIVRLEQGKENRIRPLTEKEGFHTLLSAIEKLHWSTEALDLALEVSGHLAKETRMLHLSCRPDEDAVRTLENYLERESNANF